MNTRTIRAISTAVTLGAALVLSAPVFADGHGGGGGGFSGGGGGRGGYSMPQGGGAPAGGRMGMAPSRGGFSGSHAIAPSNGGRFSSPRASAPAYNGSRFNGARAGGPMHSGSRFSSAPRAGAPMYNGSRFNSTRPVPSNGSRFVAAPGGRYGYTTGRTYNRPGFNRPGHGIAFGGRPRYWAGGNYHGYYWPRAYYHSGFVRFVGVLPAFYSTYYWGGIPYYYWDDTYYTWSPSEYGYVATDPPPAAGDDDSSDNGSAQPQSGESSSLYIYPKNGQSEEQTSNDRYECHQWAASQTGFDPTNGANQSSGSSGPDDYRRAMMACLDARGYSAR